MHSPVPRRIINTLSESQRYLPGLVAKIVDIYAVQRYSKFGFFGHVQNTMLQISPHLFTVTFSSVKHDAQGLGENDSALSILSAAAAYWESQGNLLNWTLLCQHASIKTYIM